MSPVVLDAITAFSLLVTAYFVLWNGSLIVMCGIAAIVTRTYVRRRTARDRALARHLASPPLVSVIVPAFNEALTITESIRTMLRIDYEPCEVVVVNDGSSDDTLRVLQEAFQLVPAPVAFEQPLRSAQVRAIYRSSHEPALVVIDKERGGSKSDPVNAGINAASGTLVLVIDADTVIEPDGVSRAVLPFLEDARTVAVGANLGVANGSHIENGRIEAVRLPRSWFARFQVVEYMRSFLLFRTACAPVNALNNISGAFGLFRRDVVIAVGGYDRRAIGEDMDMTMRLHEYFRSRREPYRIAYDPFTLCSTQVPEDYASLSGQRTRWRRGLLQVLWSRRRMIGNPRSGILGTCVLPYILVTEGLGPLLEIAGYVVTTVAALLGFLNWHHYRLLLAASFLFGIASTLAAVLLSDVATRRYMRGRDLGLLVAAAILENFGYRQLNAWWSCVGTMQFLTRRRGWGVMNRRVFEGVATPVQMPVQSAATAPSVRAQRG
jgi:cellulose synthase/poly-beta-1,6-N-acetylglucosamine synthase-like glycosyltransferase